MENLIVVGSLLFWIVIVLECILLTLFIYNDVIIPALVSILIFIGLIEFGTTIDLWPIIIHNPIPIILLLCGYVIAGVVWGFFKWRVFVGHELEKYNDVKRRYLKDNNITSLITPADKHAWKRYLNRNYKIDFAQVPSIRDHKSTWTQWVAFWPVSLLLYVVADLLLDLFNKLYSMLASLLQSVANNVWKEAIKDMEDDNVTE